MERKRLSDSKVQRNAALPPNAGKGRVKGVPNRVTTSLKEAILLAAERVGSNGKGKDGLLGYLMTLALKERKSFAHLLVKVLPYDVRVFREPATMALLEALGMQNEAQTSYQPLDAEVSSVH